MVLQITHRRVLSLAAVVIIGVLAGLLGAPAAPASTAPTQQRLALGARVLLGAHVAGIAEDPTRLSDFERATGRTTDIASFYSGYDGAGGGGVFPGARELGFADEGRRDVLVGWDMGPTRFSEWAAGVHDAYLQQIADAARDYPYTVYVRPWAEMNGDWAAYQPTASGDRPHGGTYAEFRQAWRHVVTYFRERGVTNLRWVFNAAAETYAATTPVEKIWPGRRYVDVLGLDGFNWGSDSGWGTWRSFTSIFRDQYRRLTALHPTAPVWVCETSSKEPLADDGSPIDPVHDKGQWIRAAFATTTMPRLAAVVWFDEQKERDWRVSSSPGSLLAMRRAVGDL